MMKNVIQPRGAGLTISIDDCHPRNMDIGETLLSLGLRGTFFLETAHALAEQQAKELSAMGHVIGSHTVSHPPDMKMLPLEEIRSELQVSKTMIEDWTGQPCTVFAYPKGKYNEEVMEVAKVVGYLEARTTDVLNRKFTPPSVYRTPTTIHVSLKRKEYQGKGWDELGFHYWEQCLLRGEEMHIWGHAAEMMAEKQYLVFFAWLEHALQLARVAMPNYVLSTNLTRQS